MSLEGTRKCPDRTPRKISNNKMADLAQLENQLEGKQFDLALIKQRFAEANGESSKDSIPSPTKTPWFDAT